MRYSRDGRTSSGAGPNRPLQATRRPADKPSARCACWPFFLPWRRACWILAALAALLSDACQSGGFREHVTPLLAARAHAAHPLARPRAVLLSAHGVCVLRGGGGSDDKDTSGGTLLGKRRRDADGAGEGSGAGGSDAPHVKDAHSRMDSSKLGLLLQRAAAYSGRCACSNKRLPSAQHPARGTPTHRPGSLTAPRLLRLLARETAKVSRGPERNLIRRHCLRRKRHAAQHRSASTQACHRRRAPRVCVCLCVCVLCECVCPVFHSTDYRLSFPLPPTPSLALSLVH